MVSRDGYLIIDSNRIPLIFVTKLTTGGSCPFATAGPATAVKDTATAHAQKLTVRGLKP